MNIRPKQFTRVISLRLNKQEYETVLSKFQRRKEDRISANIKRYLFAKISEEPVIEYTIKQKGDKMEVTVWENGTAGDSLIYDSIEQARKYVRSIDAKKRR
jgi:glutamate synthase domain-containing protein 3